MLSPTKPSNLEHRLTAGLASRSAARWLASMNEGVGYSDVLVSTAQVLALNAAPVIAVPAPGAGNYLQFLGAIVLLDFNSAAYVDDAGEDLVFKYTDESGAAVSQAVDGDVFDGTADVLAFFNPLNADAATLAGAVNAPIVLHLLVGEWITGDSPLKVRTFFRTVDVAGLEAITTAAVAA